MSHNNLSSNGGTEAPGPQEQDWPGTTSDMTPQPDHGEAREGKSRLTGRRALVTGGDSGIGRAIVLRFAQEGADVAFTYLPQEEDDAVETLELARRTGTRVFAVSADLRDHDSVSTVVSAAATELGGLDLVVANAGYQMSLTSGLLDLTSEQLERTYATNVFGAIWLVQESLRYLSAGACILLTTSIQAYQPSPHLVDYASTKAALNNLTVNLAGDLGSQGIRVNAVAPGPIWTPLIPATFPAGHVARFGKDTPLGRPGQPVEVADAFVFLASEEASFISGSVLGVTGGKAVF